MRTFLGIAGGRPDRRTPDVLDRCAQTLGGTVETFSSDILHIAAMSPAAAVVRGPCRLILDGWLADRAGLAAALSMAPGMADADLVAAALERWGEGALPRLHGHFALAWWDEAARRLLLACDRTGGRTLFLHAEGGRLAFSGLLSALLADPGVPRGADPDRLARTAFFNGAGWNAVCLRGIDRLPPAHLLRWTPTGWGMERYWRPDPSRRIRFARDEDYVEAARELLDRVVADILPDEDPIVARLTGGLDSSAVAATAARLSGGRPVHTLTIRPDPAAALLLAGPRQFNDEWPHAVAVAEMHPALRPLPVFARLGSIGDQLRGDAAFIGHPSVHLLSNLWAASMWEEGRRLGARVMLGGHGGNATLSVTGLTPIGQPWGLADLPDLWADRRGRWRYARAWGGIPGGLRSLAPAWLRDLRRRLAGTREGWLDRLPLRPAVTRRIGMAAAIAAETRGDADVPWRLRWRLGLMERSWQANALGSPLRFRRGVEILDPLADVRLAEFCLALPADQFIRGPFDRALARRTLADRLPPLVTEETRRGRQIPEWFDWLTRSRDALAAELDGIDASPLGREIIDVPRLRAIMADWPADADAAAARYVELAGTFGRGIVLGVFACWADGL